MNEPARDIMHTDDFNVFTFNSFFSDSLYTIVVMYNDGTEEMAINFSAK